MGKCIDCKHWKYRLPVEKNMPDMATCMKLLSCDPEEGITPIFPAEVDEDINEEGFLTGKHFGCIHFESK